MFAIGDGWYIIPKPLGPRVILDVRNFKSGNGIFLYPSQYDLLRGIIDADPAFFTAEVQPGVAQEPYQIGYNASFIRSGSELIITVCINLTVFTVLT